MRADRSKSRLLRDDAGGIVQKMHAILSENKNMSFEGAYQTSAIKQAYEKYANSGNRREFNAAVRYLGNMLSRDKAALDEGLVPEKGTPDSDIILSEVIMFLKMGVSTGDTILKMLDTSRKPEYRKWRENGFSRPEALFYQNASFDMKKVLPLKGVFATPKEAKILLKSRIKDPIQFLQEFRRCKIPLSKNMVFGHLTDEGLVQPMQRLGSGEFNTVYKGTYRLPGATVFNGVYKAEDAGRSDGVGMCPSALESGIDPGNPRYGLRNIASVRLNNLLGFSVLPHTEFGIHQGKLGVVMAHAKGIHPFKFVTNDMTSNYHPREIKKIRRDKNLAKHMAKVLKADRVYVKDGRLKKRNGYVIAPESWGSKFATERLSSQYTSYLGREQFFLGEAFALDPKNVVTPEKMAQM